MDWRNGHRRQKRSLQTFQRAGKEIEEYISIEKSWLQKEDSKVLQQVLKDLDLTLMTQ